MKVPTYTTVSPAPAEKLAGITVPVPPPIARFYLGHYTAIPAKSVPEHSGCLSMSGARCTEHRKLSGVPGTPPRPEHRKLRGVPGVGPEALPEAQ